MASPFAPALAPLKRYAEFGGRSTRTELALFYVLVTALNIGVDFLGGLLGPRVAPYLALLLLLAIACPTLALLVRRLHDSGRSGWWLLAGLPGFGFASWHLWLKLFDPYAMSPLNDFSFPVGLGVALLTTLLFVLLLWNDEEAANRYGPNPRDGEAAAAS